MIASGMICNDIKQSIISIMPLAIMHILFTILNFEYFVFNLGAQCSADRKVLLWRSSHYRRLC